MARSVRTTPSKKAAREPTVKTRPRPAAVVKGKARAQDKGAPASKAQARALEAERVDETLVDDAVEHLRRLVVVGQVETVAAVGEYLIERFYGSPAAARSKSPNKPASLRRLAQRADEFGMSASTLAYAAPLALAVRDLGRSLAGRLGVKKVRALVPLKVPAQRKQIAEEALAANWHVERVRERVGQLIEPHAGGRPQRPPVARVVGRIAKLLGPGSEGADATLLRAGIDGVDAAQASQLLDEVMRARSSLERIEKLLVRRARRG